MHDFSLMHDSRGSTFYRVQPHTVNEDCAELGTVLDLVWANTSLTLSTLHFPQCCTPRTNPSFVFPGLARGCIQHPLLSNILLSIGFNLICSSELIFLGKNCENSSVSHSWGRNYFSGTGGAGSEADEERKRRGKRKERWLY